MVLQPKSNIRKAILTTYNTYIGCRFGDMTFSQGSSTNKFTLYPHAKLIIDHDTPLWVGNTYSNEENAL